MPTTSCFLFFGTSPRLLLTELIPSYVPIRVFGRHPPANSRYFPYSVRPSCSTLHVGGKVIELSMKQEYRETSILSNVQTTTIIACHPPHEQKQRSMDNRFLSKYVRNFCLVPAGGACYRSNNQVLCLHFATIMF